MSHPSKINKENFRLLDLSSDEESEDLQLEIIPSRKKKITRRERSRSAAQKASEPNIGAEVQCALRWAFRGTLLLWLMMLTWICASLYDQVTTMRLEMNKVSTSSDGVDDALQFCHTAAKELRANASNLSTRLAKLELDHLELASIVKKAVGELEAVQAQLSAAPELREIPKRLGDLQKTVGELGSQINSFDGAISAAKKQALTAVTGVEDVKTLLHQLEGRTNETIANVSANEKRDDELKHQVENVNSTLQAKVEALNLTVLELTQRTSSTSAPTTSTSTTPSTTSSTSTTTTTTLPPGPPVKPIVLEVQ